jgi:hypothetical protein
MSTFASAWRTLPQEYNGHPVHELPISTTLHILVYRATDNGWSWLASHLPECLPVDDASGFWNADAAMQAADEWAATD